MRMDWSLVSMYRSLPLLRPLLFLLHSRPWHLDSYLGSGDQTQVVKLEYFYLLNHLPSSCLFVDNVILLRMTYNSWSACLYLSNTWMSEVYHHTQIYLCVCACVSAHYSCFKLGVPYHFLSYSLRKSLTRPEASLEDSKPHQSSCLLFNAGMTQAVLAMCMFLCICLGFELRFPLKHCSSLLSPPFFFSLREDVSVCVCNYTHHQTVNIYLSEINLINTICCISLSLGGCGCDMDA